MASPLQLIDLWVSSGNQQIPGHTQFSMTLFNLRTVLFLQHKTSSASSLCTGSSRCLGYLSPHALLFLLLKGHLLKEARLTFLSPQQPILHSFTALITLYVYLLVVCPPLGGSSLGLRLCFAHSCVSGAWHRADAH